MKISGINLFKNNYKLSSNDKKNEQINFGTRADRALIQEVIEFGFMQKLKTKDIFSSVVNELDGVYSGALDVQGNHLAFNSVGKNSHSKLNVDFSENVISIVDKAKGKFNKIIYTIQDNFITKRVINSFPQDPKTSPKGFAGLTAQENLYRFNPETGKNEHIAIITPLNRSSVGFDEAEQSFFMSLGSNL